MAKKRAASAYLTDFEMMAGGVLLCVYLLFLPFLSDKLFDQAAYLLGTAVPALLREQIVYWVLLLLAAGIFCRLLVTATQYLWAALSQTIAAAGLSLVLFYGLNELLVRFFEVVLGAKVNLSDTIITAQTAKAPQESLLVMVVLMPIVEELLFRGYVFGLLRGRDRVMAYGASCLLYTALYIGRLLLEGGGLPGVALVLQYLTVSAVLAWSYDKTGTIWTPVLVHITVNALA